MKQSQCFEPQDFYGLQPPDRYAASLDCLGGVAALEGLGGLAGCEIGLAPCSSAFGRFSSLARYAASLDCRFGVRGSCTLLLLGRSISWVISRGSCTGVAPVPSTLGRLSSLARNAASRDCFFGLRGLGVVSPSDCSIFFSFSCGSSTSDWLVSPAFHRFSTLARYAASRDCLFGLKGLVVLLPLSSLICVFSCGSSTGCVSKANCSIWLCGPTADNPRLFLMVVGRIFDPFSVFLGYLQ